MAARIFYFSEPLSQNSLDSGFAFLKAMNRIVRRQKENFGMSHGKSMNWIYRIFIVDPHSFPFR